MSDCSENKGRFIESPSMQPNYNYGLSCSCANTCKYSKTNMTQWNRSKVGLQPFNIFQLSPNGGFLSHCGYPQTIQSSRMSLLVLSRLWFWGSPMTLPKPPMDRTAGAPRSECANLHLLSLHAPSVSNFLEDCDPVIHRKFLLSQLQTVSGNMW